MTHDQRVRLVDGSFETWSEMAQQMTACLRQLVPHATIEHIGSTSVPSLPAKPVIDMAVGVGAEAIGDTTQLLVQQGFDLEGEKPRHSWLSFPDRTARKYVIHVLEDQGRQFQRRLLFRDTLRNNPNARRRYLEVKRKAAEESADWDEYTHAKTETVHEILDAAVSGVTLELSVETGPGANDGTLLDGTPRTVIPRFVRWQAQTANRHGHYPGVFALANGLAKERRLSEEDWAWWRASNDWFNVAYADPAAVNSEVYDSTVHPGGVAYFKSSAVHLLERVPGYLKLLDKYGVDYKCVRTDSPGVIIYEDDVQIVAIE